MYTSFMAPDRRYQLQSEDANRRIDALLEQLRVPEETWRLYSELLTTVLKMYEDKAPVVDLKMTTSALKEIRYGLKVFAPFRHLRKVTVFGSARLPAGHPVSEQAVAFGRAMADASWMVITGAGSGVMGAAQEGAGRERSFGLNIRLPFEQEANPWIADDPKLISFKYFFTRKLFLVREAHAMAFLPGGFGTADEFFEALTLVQTGKAVMVPLVLLDGPGGHYWHRFDEFIKSQMQESGMVSPADVGLYRITDDCKQASAEIERFYEVFHSQRYVGPVLVLRLRRALPPAVVTEISARFDDILHGPAELASGPVAGERDEYPELPRLVLPFSRRDFGRLRQLVDFVNAS